MKKINEITVIGLGYVGLPNALLLAQNRNNSVVGVDRDKEVVKKLNDKISHIIDEDISKYLLRGNNFYATQDIKEVFQEITKCNR